MKKELYFKRLVNRKSGEIKAEPSYGYIIKGEKYSFCVEKISYKVWNITERDTGMFAAAALSFKDAKKWIISSETHLDTIFKAIGNKYQGFYEKSLKAYKESENDTEKDC